MEKKRWPSASKLSFFALVVVIPIFLTCYITEERKLYINVDELYLRTPRDWTHIIAKVLESNHRQIVVDRDKVKVTKELWESLKEGDTLILVEHTEYFKIFGRTFVIEHYDELRK